MIDYAGVSKGSESWWVSLNGMKSDDSGSKKNKRSNINSKIILFIIMNVVD
jgi:hypothetical protein